MRNDYSGPGQYEGLSPFHAFIAAHIDQLATETAGDVESPSGWFALVETENVRPDRRRSFLVETDSQGFWYVWEQSEADGQHHGGQVFDAKVRAYDEWAGADDE